MFGVCIQCKIDFRCSDSFDLHKMKSCSFWNFESKTLRKYTQFQSKEINSKKSVYEY